MTTGVDIVGGYMRDDAELLALVPEAQMKAGALPDNVALPALLIRCVSSVERQKLKRDAITRTIDRVAVTVRAASYREQVEVMRLVKKSCAGQIGFAGEGGNLSVLAAGTGPDVRGPGNSFEQTQDFRVSYDAS